MRGFFISGVDPDEIRERITGARVLCVDDDKSVCGMLARRLTHLGYVTSTATSAAEAHRLLAEQSFDALITDYQMPGDNGLVLARDAVHAHPRLVVFLLTGSVEPSYETLREHEVSEVFGKPFEFIEVARKLEWALGNRLLGNVRQSA